MLHVGADLDIGGLANLLQPVRDGLINYCSAASLSAQVLVLRHRRVARKFARFEVVVVREAFLNAWYH